MAGFRVPGFWLPVLAAGGIAVSLPAVTDAAFPGRNGRIAYENPRSEAVGSQILSVLPDGSQPRTLLGFGDPRHTRRGSYVAPADSPDGRRLAFADTAHHSPSFPVGSSLYLVRSSGRGPLRHLTRSRNDKRDFATSWSPDGHRLSYVRNQLAPAPPTDPCLPRWKEPLDLLAVLRWRRPSAPVWSVRGQIAFGWRDAIYTMRPDGSHRRRVVGGYGPEWSPRGHRIFFSRCAGGCGIAMIRPNGHGLRLLTSEEGAGGPVFSPNGRYIVYRFDPDVFGEGAAPGSQAGLVVMLLRDRSKRMILPGYWGGYDWQPLPRQ